MRGEEEIGASGQMGKRVQWRVGGKKGYKKGKRDIKREMKRNFGCFWK